MSIAVLGERVEKFRAGTKSGDVYTYPMPRNGSPDDEPKSDDENKKRSDDEQKEGPHYVYLHVITAFEVDNAYKVCFRVYLWSRQREEEKTISGSDVD